MGRWKFVIKLVDAPEFVAGIDEDVRLAGEVPASTAVEQPASPSAARRHRERPAARRGARGDKRSPARASPSSPPRPRAAPRPSQRAIASSVAPLDRKRLAVKLVVFDHIVVEREKRPQPHVKNDRAHIDPPRANARQKILGEMKPRRRRGDGSLFASEHGLIPLAIGLAIGRARCTAAAARGRTRPAPRGPI